MINTTSHPDTREAHVQVLTAEVRTLVVGSRQVTMSVYNQLDDVPPQKIEPFGRVRPRTVHGPFIFVVGCDKATGSLVRSHIPQHPESLNDKGWVPKGPGVWAIYEHWPVGATPQRLVATAAQWSALPLIVLAGLR